jgi:hypothetical protein
MPCFIIFYSLHPLSVVILDFDISRIFVLHLYLVILMFSGVYLSLLYISFYIHMGCCIFISLFPGFCFPSLWQTVKHSACYAS